MTVYLLTKRGVLHKAIRDESGAVATFEGDNLDQSDGPERYGELAQVPADRIKRWCKRCFPGGRTT